MSELRELCEQAGFENVVTYIQSGNVVFRSKVAAPEAKRALEAALSKKMGKHVDVLLRTPAELDAILRRNPFKNVAPNRLLVLFLDRAIPKNGLVNLEIPGREEVKASGREVFIHYPDGMGRSKLKIPLTGSATGRNLNTVRKLLELSVAAAKNS